MLVFEAIELMLVHSDTIICKVFLPTQLLVPLPLAEYVVLTLGETEILLVLIPPDQVYVFAPLAVKVTPSPKHMAVAVDEILKIGNGLTVMLLVAKACDKHPAVLVPATVKLALLGGLTTGFPPCIV